MNEETREIKAHLGLAPRTASDLAESAEMPIETVYQALVRLHDAGEARIDIQYGASAHRVLGWVQA